MIFSRLFQSKKTKWDNSRRYLKSESDLKLLSNQVIYVEGEYSNAVNRVITENYDTISTKLKHAGWSDFIYLPVIAGQIRREDVSFRDILSYYFPNNRSANVSSVIPALPRTDVISKRLFSVLFYNEEIHPGFFRYMGKDSEGLFVYEYFPFASGGKSKITSQVTYYTDTISRDPQYTLPIPAKDDVISFELEKPSPKSIFEKKIEQRQKKFLDFLFDDDLSEEESIEPNDEVSEKNEETGEVRAFKMATPPFVAKEVREEKPLSKEYELITRIKSDIQNLKELGFYDILLKEIGSVLYADEKEKMFQPSRLVIDDDYRIFLPDFDMMEIEMSPLPKTLFILFLRHPGGINLKSLIDYKTELLEIYKLLSYRETYFNMVESINRICNPLEGSINEKLSRIKEAFQKEMSMDTAQHYIVKGERGMEKRIEIDRSLIVFPDAFTEIKLTT